MKTLPHHSLVFNGFKWAYDETPEEGGGYVYTKETKTGWLPMRVLPLDLTNGNAEYFALHGLTNTNKIKVKKTK